MIILGPIRPPAEDCGYRTPDPQYVDPPAEFTVAGHEGRLIPRLRQAARAAVRDPVAALARSAALFYQERGRRLPVSEATAVADLCVSGRAAYTVFGLRRPTDAQVRAAVQALLPAAGAADVAWSARAALDRAYSVAWALRGPAAWRRLARPGQRWIAVSGEDDRPHRPVNVPSAPYPQHDLTLRVRGVAVQTRYMIAAAPTPAGDAPGGGAAADPRFDIRTLPPDQAPSIPAQDEVILFIHGHSSRLEEALDLVPWLHRSGAAHGRRFTVIAMDLPNCGYASMFNHTRVAPPDASQWHLGDVPLRPTWYPILDFIEDFIIAFVDTLDAQVPIKHRIAAVIGGSLGGNLGLRLGRRDPERLPWLRNIVAWSPASVWNSLANADDLFKDIALNQTRDRMNEPERAAARANYFHQVFEDKIPPLIGRTQPEMWYRDGWEPCKSLYIEAARRDRREIYNAWFRRWHWRVALEQLLYSHLDPERRGGRPRYTANRIRTLLAVGEHDNHIGTHIYDATRNMARGMGATLGRVLLLRETGHSIHSERPQSFAAEIVNFLPAAGPQAIAQAMWGHGHSVSVEHPDRIGSLWRAGFHATVRGRAGQYTWLHFALPTPVIRRDQRQRAGSLLLRYRTPGADAWIAAVHLFDGERRIAAYEGFHEADTDWAVKRFNVPGRPAVRWGLGVSIQVAFAGSSDARGADAHRIDFSAVGCDFVG